MFSQLNEGAARPNKTIEPCGVIIFGVTGDLTARKLMPALFNLYLQELLPSQFYCLGVARKEKSEELFRQEVYQALETFSRAKPSQNLKQWEAFSKVISYQQTPFDSDEAYTALGKRLESLEPNKECGRLFYLSTPPTFFPLIAEKLSKHKLVHDYLPSSANWSRVIIEKPFGYDEESALKLNATLSSLLHESQIFRIDHYLGKDTVQNLLAMRFSNLIFESIWNHRYIDHIQISVSEELGIGRRGAFFEEAGILRDVIQNHLMQLLSLVAMESPVTLQATDIHNEKVKVLKAIKPLDLKNASNCCERGQYSSGPIQGQTVPAYREERDVSPTSQVETYAALRLEIDNWRWSGVPFYLRAGKRLGKRASQIAIVFKNVPTILFPSDEKGLQSNALIIRIQPDDGISLKINCKLPNLGMAIRPVSLDFDFDSLNHTPPEAYERLLCDCMLGDNTLYARNDEVLESWKLLTPLLKYWAAKPLANEEFYPAGSMGPAASVDLLQKQGHGWYDL